MYTKEIIIIFLCNRTRNEDFADLKQAATFNLAALGKSSILKGITSVSLLEDIFENSRWLIVKIRYLFIFFQSYFCSNDDYSLSFVMWCEERSHLKSGKNHFDGIRYSFVHNTLWNVVLFDSLNLQNSLSLVFESVTIRQSISYFS
jgi:hypothetical protein